MCLRLVPTVGTPVGITRRHTSSSEETGDTRLDGGARTTEPMPTDVDQAGCISASDAWWGIQIEAQWRGRHAADEQPRPGRVVRKIEQRVGAAEPDLLG